MPKKKRGGTKRTDASSKKDDNARMRNFQLYKNSMLSLPPAKVIESVRNKEDIPTDVVFALIGDWTNPTNDDQRLESYANQLISAGLIDVVLDIVNSGGIEGMGGVFPTSYPSMWLGILSTIAYE